MFVHMSGKCSLLDALGRSQKAEIEATLTIPLHIDYYAEVKKSVVAVRNILRNRVKEGVHLSRVVAALLRFAGIGKAGSPAEHRSGFPEGQASADR